MERFIAGYEQKFRKWGVYVISVPVLIMTVIEVLNVIGRRYVIPFPCALEAVESLLVICVYFGVPIVALEMGHVNIVMATRKLPLVVQNFLEAFGSLVGTALYGFWAYGAWIESLKSLGILEMRIGVYRFPLWPFRLLFAVGLTFLVIQLAINVVKLTYVALGRTRYAGMDKLHKPDDISEIIGQGG